MVCVLLIAIYHKMTHMAHDVYRDKAPFMLIVEVLSENEEPEKVGNGEEAKDEEPHDLDEVLLDERTGSHAAAGPGIILDPIIFLHLNRTIVSTSPLKAGSLLLSLCEI